MELPLCLCLVHPVCFGNSAGDWLLLCCGHVNRSAAEMTLSRTRRGSDQTWTPDPESSDLKDTRLERKVGAWM